MDHVLWTSLWGVKIGFWIAVTWVAAGIILLVIAALGVFLGSDTIPLLTRDPASLSQTHPLYGLLSNLGAACELLSAAVFAWTALLLRIEISTDRLIFLFGGAVISALLWIDDFFMMHDFVLRFYLGVPETLSLGAGAALVLAWFWIFRKTYAEHRLRLFATALGFLIGSVMIDQLEFFLMPRIGDWSYLLEDGLKWLGIVAWTLWHFTFCHQLLMEHLARITLEIQSERQGA